MIDLTQIMTALIAIIAAIATRYLVPWIKGNTNAHEREDLLEWAKISVMAAEQLYWQSSGPERKQYVVDFLRNQGFDVDDKAVDNAIEAAVLALHKEISNGDG